MPNANEQAFKDIMQDIQSVPISGKVDMKARYGARLLYRFIMKNPDVWYDRSFEMLRVQRKLAQRKRSV